MSRTQLLEVEARLKSTLATLQERSLQYEELMDSHQRLRYRPRSPPSLEPLCFWEIEPLLGGGGHTGGHGSGHCCPNQALIAQVGGRGCGEAQQDPVLGEAA